jgi:glycosyltransferase involved in cell wall biosynthesis
MAAGCCVVASQLPHLAGVVEHGVNGFLFPPGDVAALRAILTELLADPARCAAVGRAAAKTVQARFGVQHEVEHLNALYAGLCDEAAR